MIYTFLITCFGLHNKHSFFFFVLIVFRIKFIPLGNFIQDKFVEFLLFRKQYTRYYPLTSRIFLSIRTDKIIIRQGSDLYWLGIGIQQFRKGFFEAVVFPLES